MTPVRVVQIVLRVLGMAALVFVGAWVVGSAPATSLERWPARDQLYARYCALEVQQNRIPFSEFEACLHRLTAHRGDVCTHGRGGAR